MVCRAHPGPVANLIYYFVIAPLAAAMLLMFGDTKAAFEIFTQ